MTIEALTDPELLLADPAMVSSGIRHSSSVIRQCA
jgi:hypothetical protein